MSDKTFVDTNILVYAYDLDAGRKRQIAKNILQELWEAGTGALSTQVLQEFYVSVTRKLPHRLGKDDARQITNTYAGWSTAVAYSEILEAFRIEDKAGLDFWDALIVASATRSGAGRLLTEDLNHGQIIAGIRIENPFV